MPDEYFFREGCFITELSNSAADETLSVARARVESGVTTRWHLLRGTTERYLIIAGRGCVEIGDQAPQDVEANDLVVIPPDIRQRITNIGDDDLIFLAICSPRFRPDNYVDIDSNG